jgi:anti-sigma factor RsiW
MSCSPFDLRDYCFEELRAEERRQVEAHLGACSNCREEVERLQATHRTLLRLQEEEVPRRIAFVSDKVFEPSTAARWWAKWLGGMPRFAFSAALLLAVFFTGAWISRPSITVEKGRWQVAFGGGDSRVEQTLAAVEARHAAEMSDVKESYEILVKEMNVLYRQAAETRPATFRQ